MPILNFPNSPVQGQLYVDSDRAWVFTGSVWASLNTRLTEYWVMGGSIDAGSATNNSATVVLTSVSSDSLDGRQASRYANSVTFTTAGTYSLTVPPGVNHCRVEVWGGGGSGGGANSVGTQPGGSGGGSGGAASLTIRGVRPGTVFSNFTVGAGGAQVAVNTNGNAGGSSSFTYNGVTLTATGGAGGAGGAAGTAAGGTGSINIGTALSDASSSPGNPGSAGSYDNCTATQNGGAGGSGLGPGNAGGGGTGGGAQVPGVLTGAAGTAGAIRFTFGYNPYYSLG